MLRDRSTVASGPGTVICIIHQAAGGRKTRRGGRLEGARGGVARQGNEEKDGTAPDSTRGDSPALLGPTVIFYWVYDVINLIAVSAHRLNRDASETVDTCRAPLPASCHLGNFRLGQRCRFTPRYTPEYVNYPLYGPSVHSFLSRAPSSHRVHGSFSRPPLSGGEPRSRLSLEQRGTIDGIAEVSGRINGTVLRNMWSSLKYVRLFGEGSREFLTSSYKGIIFNMKPLKKF